MCAEIAQLPEKKYIQYARRHNPRFVYFKYILKVKKFFKGLSR